MEKDTFKTLSKPSTEVLFKDRNSKFYGLAFPVSTEDDVKAKLAQVKEQHRSARHWCYAYQIGIEEIAYRVNDDGEPNNSAGQPIYGQIQAFDLTNVLIVVVRYFGGVKLGVGGLINAYRSTAQLALESSKIITKFITTTFLIQFEYKDMNKVMRIIKQHQLNVISQEQYLDCKLTIDVRKKDSEAIKTIFDGIHGVEIKEL